MKREQIEKRLNFRKATVSNLNDGEMNALFGGLIRMQTCDPQISTCYHSCGYTVCADSTCCSTGTEPTVIAAY